MNGIGIVEWLDNQTEYPLKNAGYLGGLFSDASFIMYDNFIPVLNTINVTITSLIINITFDDGSSTFTIPITNISEGASYRFYLNNRSYGVVVFGRLINDILANVYGTSISAGVSFDPSVVRSINSVNGVYSINGLSGDVTIDFDDNISMTGTRLDAVSLPSNLEIFKTDIGSVYLYTNSQNLAEMNLSTNELTYLNALDKDYSIIYNFNGNWLGVVVTSSASTIFDLTSIPSAPVTGLTNIPGIITALSSDNAGNLWALVGNSLVQLSNTGIYSVGTPISIGLTGSSGMSCFDDYFIVYLPGPKDYSTNSTYYSNLLYKVTVSAGVATTMPLGLLNDPVLGNKLPWLISMFVLNGNLYGASISGVSGNIYQIDPVNATVINAGTVTGNSISGDFISAFLGGPSITINNVVALKTINSITPSGSQINLLGSSTVNVTQSSGDTITIGLPVATQYLNVKRTTTYE